jgi:hypothetical protein
MRKFNTSGPNFPEKNYTIQRTALIEGNYSGVQQLAAILNGSSGF